MRTNSSYVTDDGYTIDDEDDDNIIRSIKTVLRGIINDNSSQQSAPVGNVDEVNVVL